MTTKRLLEPDSGRSRSQEAGFAHHLVKPVDPEALLGLIARLKFASL